MFIARQCRFLTHILQMVYVLVVPSFKFQVSRMSGTSSKTAPSTISRLDPWRTCRFLTHILQIVYVLVVPSFKFQVSRMSGTSSKTALSTISRLDPWRTCRFLMHILQIVYVLVVPSFKFQVSRMSGTLSSTRGPDCEVWSGLVTNILNFILKVKNLSPQTPFIHNSNHQDPLYFMRFLAS